MFLNAILDVCPCRCTESTGTLKVGLLLTENAGLLEGKTAIKCHVKKKKKLCNDDNYAIDLARCHSLINMLSEGSSKKFSSHWGDFNPRDINKTNNTNKTFPFKPDQIRMFSFCRTETALIVTEVLKVKNEVYLG